MRLARDRCRDLGVRVAEHVDSDAGDQVEVLASGLVVHQAAAPANEGHGNPFRRVHQVAVGELLDGRLRHSGAPPLGLAPAPRTSKDRARAAHPLTPHPPLRGRPWPYLGQYGRIAGLTTLVVKKAMAVMG